MKPIYKDSLMTAALVWGGCSILFVFVYVCFLSPQGRSKKAVEEQLAQKERQYNLAVDAARDEARIRLDEEMAALRILLGNFVADFEDSTNLTFEIGRIAEEKKVDKLSIKTRDSHTGSARADCEYIFENRITVRFAAGFKQFAALLNSLERHRPVVFVEDFRITRSTDDNLSHEVSMNLAVLVEKQRDS